MEPTKFTVSELNNFLKQYIDLNPVLSNVCISGEISNYKLYPSGHHYFSLKDENSSLPCVMFKGSAYSLKFKPENGLSVLAYGYISVFQRDGKYQLYCESLHSAGAGDLSLAFEQLKAKLSGEGLFDEDHKKPIPRFPETVCVITSSAGAAVHDIIRIINKRWPLTDIKLVPVRVQGEEAPFEISEAIEFANSNNLADVIIVGRGGGSIEDLWAFNTEIVARAIYNSGIPVISAVGHEPDVTIADYVSDVRASTPSNAAELVVPDINEFYNYIESLRKNLDPKSYIYNKRMEIDSIREKISTYESIIIYRKRQQIDSIKTTIESLNPLGVLARGFSYVTSENKPITDSSDLKPGDRLSILFSSGKANCIVEEVLE